MLVRRDDGIFDIHCDECGLKLTECITGDLPIDTPTAMAKAWAEGWIVTPAEQICLGCSNVQQ